MKKSLKLLSIAFSGLLLVGCGQEIDLKAQAPKWDVQTCDRCKMLLSDTKFSAQIVNPADGKHYFFDDLGCALLWLQTKEAQGWADHAIVYATDPQNGKWLNIADNQLIFGYVTPMAYGLGVLPKGSAVPEGKKAVSKEEALRLIEDIKNQKAARRKLGQH